MQADKTMNVAPMNVGPDPFNTTCPQCGARILTKTSREAGVGAWVGCGILCLFGCWLGCCLIPFCVDALNKTIHRCPQCNAFIGRYE